MLRSELTSFTSDRACALMWAKQHLSASLPFMFVVGNCSRCQVSSVKKVPPVSLLVYLS